VLTLSPAVRIYLATGATDLRRSIDGLSALVRKRLEQGTFAWPTDPPPGPVEMRSTDLALLLSGVDVAQTRRRRWYERVA
jgi:transposase